MKIMEINFNDMRPAFDFCARCGERLNIADSRNNDFNFIFGYGSVRDGKQIKFKLCSPCLDVIFDFITILKENSLDTI